MRKLILSLTCLVMALATAGPPALAQDYKLGELEITQAWSRATPRGAKVGAGYLTIVNRGAAADRLVSATTSAAASVELHEMSMRDGVMTMRPLASGIPLAAGATVKLAPGGLHMMLMGLKSELKQGDSFKAQLVFEKAGVIEIPFVIQSVGAREPQGHGHGGHGR